jgi:hypothetical protein
MHLLVAASQDATADMIVEGLGDKVLRINNDRHQDHRILITGEGFRIRDDYGREVTEKNLKTLILRKIQGQAPNREPEPLYVFREYTRAIESLLDYVGFFTPEKLPINHMKMDSLTKFVMAKVAKDYFHVPSWAFTTHPKDSGIAAPVLKNLCGLPFAASDKSIDDSKFVYVQPVKINELADGWPWYIQEQVDARYDLTIAYIGGKTFGLSLERAKFDGLDWRKFIGTDVDNHWKHFEIPHSLHDSIAQYMKALGIEYGRLDFLSNDPTFHDVIFLEVNPHGQWAWMDLEKNNGIYDCMMEFLTTPRNSIV